MCATVRLQSLYIISFPKLSPNSWVPVGSRDTILFNIQAGLRLPDLGPVETICASPSYWMNWWNSAACTDDINILLVARHHLCLLNPAQLIILPSQLRRIGKPLSILRVADRKPIESIAPRNLRSRFPAFGGWTNGNRFKIFFYRSKNLHWGTTSTSRTATRRGILPVAQSPLPTTGTANWNCHWPQWRSVPWRPHQQWMNQQQENNIKDKIKQTKQPSVVIFKNICMFMCMYIYRERERKKEKERDR